MDCGLISLVTGFGPSQWLGLGKNFNKKIHPKNIETKNNEKMPWQSVPGFMVIAGAFTLTGLGLSFVERVAYGRVSFLCGSLLHSFFLFIAIMFMFLPTIFIFIHV